MKIAAIQTVSTPDVERNLGRRARLVAQRRRRGRRAGRPARVLLPHGPQRRDKLAIAEAPATARSSASSPRRAREHGVWLVGGTLPLRSTRAKDAGPRAQRQPRLLAATATRSARYDKIHLFAFDNGREHYDEARMLQAGATPVAFDAGGLRVGLSVCYDLRFPELYRALMRPPCDAALRALGLHLHDRPRALGGAAARPRGREPVLRRRRRAGRHARERPAHLRPQRGRRSRGARSSPCRRARARASSSPSVGASASPRCGAQLPALEHRRGL